MHSMLFFVFLLCSVFLQAMPKENFDCSVYLKMSDCRLKIILSNCKDEKLVPIISSLQDKRIQQIERLKADLQSSTFQKKQNKMKEITATWEKEDNQLNKRLRQQPSYARRSSGVVLDGAMPHRVRQDLEEGKRQMLQIPPQVVAMIHCQSMQEHSIETQRGEVRPRKGVLQLSIDTLLEQAGTRAIPAQVQRESARQVEEPQYFVRQGQLSVRSAEVSGSMIDRQKSLTTFDIAEMRGGAQDLLDFAQKACNDLYSRPCKASRVDDI